MTGGREQFAEELKRRRAAKGWSLDRLRTEMEARGQAISNQGISGWEHGNFPDTPLKAKALDDALEAGGVLMVMLGWSPDGSDPLEALTRRLDAVESKLDRMTTRQAEVVKRLEALADPKPRGRSR